MLNLFVKIICLLVLFFNVKNSQPVDLRNFVVYKFSCLLWAKSSYIGSTVSLWSRISSHLGIRYKIGKILNRKEYFPIRDHIRNCTTDTNLDSFKILYFSQIKNLLESLNPFIIKILKLTLNSDVVAMLFSSLSLNVNFIFTRCLNLSFLRFC